LSVSPVISPVPARAPMRTVESIVSTVRRQPWPYSASTSITTTVTRGWSRSSTSSTAAPPSSSCIGGQHRDGARHPPEELQRMLSHGLADSRAQLPRLYSDVILSANDTVLVRLHRLVPSTQILLGTDYPFAQEIGVASTLHGLEHHAGFDDEDRRAVETDNPRRLFPRVSRAP
jgi:hypothetical protein